MSHSERRLDGYVGKTDAHAGQKVPQSCLFMEFDIAYAETVIWALGPDMRFTPEVTNAQVVLRAHRLGYCLREKTGGEGRLGTSIRQTGWPDVGLVQPSLTMTPVVAIAQPGAIILPLPDPARRLEPRKVHRPTSASRQGCQGRPHASHRLFADLKEGLIMRQENPETIRQWALETFGPHKGALSVANRAQKELDELKEAAQAGAAPEVLAEEAADVVIVLCRLFGWDDVERKMMINRGRTWVLDGNGHGQHVKKPATD